MRDVSPRLEDRASEAGVRQARAVFPSANCPLPPSVFYVLSVSRVRVRPTSLSGRSRALPKFGILARPPPSSLAWPNLRESRGGSCSSIRSFFRGCCRQTRDRRRRRWPTSKCRKMKTSDWIGVRTNRGDGGQADLCRYSPIQFRHRRGGPLSFSPSQQIVFPDSREPLVETRRRGGGRERGKRLSCI